MCMYITYSDFLNKHVKMKNTENFYLLPTAHRIKFNPSAQKVVKS